MALTVEDGSIVTGAESLCSVADADAYHSGRGTRHGLRSPPQRSGGGTAPGDRFHAAAIPWALAGLHRPEKGQPQDWPRYDVEVDGYDGVIEHRAD